MVVVFTDHVALKYLLGRFKIYKHGKLEKKPPLGFSITFNSPNDV